MAPHDRHDRHECDGDRADRSRRARRPPADDRRARGGKDAHLLSRRKPRRSPASSDRSSRGSARSSRPSPASSILPVFLAGAERSLPRGESVPLPLGIDVIIGKPRTYEPSLDARDIAEMIRADVLALAPALPRGSGSASGAPGAHRLLRHRSRGEPSALPGDRPETRGGDVRRRGRKPARRSPRLGRSGFLQRRVRRERTAAASALRLRRETHPLEPVAEVPAQGARGLAAQRVRSRAAARARRISDVSDEPRDPATDCARRGVFRKGTSGWRAPCASAGSTSSRFRRRDLDVETAAAERRGRSAGGWPPRGPRRRPGGRP